MIQSDFQRKKSGFGDFPGVLVGRGRGTQALEGSTPSTSLGFFKHFNFTNDLETLFYFILFYFYIGLEIAVEGGSKGCFGFSPPAPCSHTSSSSEWSKSDPQRRWLLCSAPQGDSGESVGPPRCDLGGSQAALSHVGICLGLSISP